MIRPCSNELLPTRPINHFRDLSALRELRIVTVWDSNATARSIFFGLATNPRRRRRANTGVYTCPPRPRSTTRVRAHLPAMARGNASVQGERPRLLPGDRTCPRRMISQPTASERSGNEPARHLPRSERFRPLSALSSAPLARTPHRARSSTARELAKNSRRLRRVAFSSRNLSA